jgi:hypothetical protein
MIGRDIGIQIGGRNWDIDVSYSHRFDRKKPNPSRAVFAGGWRSRHRALEFLLQVYRPGMSLDWHTDGSGVHNYVWSVVLWQPKVGGQLEIEGPYRKWWRFYHFDGGTSRHRVTPSTGYRVVFMIQRMKKIKPEG